MLLPFQLFAVFTLVHHAHSARVLGLFPHTGKSHQMVYEPLLRRLAERGHHVTVVSFFPLRHPPANYTDVSLEELSRLGVETVDLSFMEIPGTALDSIAPPLSRLIRRLYEFGPLAEMALNVCSKIVDYPPLAEVLKQKYDVVVMENFNSDCMLGLMHVYNVKAPIVGLSSCTMMMWSADRIGVSDNPSYVPIVASDTPIKMSFWQRFENTFLNVFYKAWFHYTVQVKEQEMIEKQFGRKIPDLQDLGKNISILLVNVFHSLNGVQPLLPAAVEVGGMHLNYTKKPEHIPAVSFLHHVFSNSCSVLAAFAQKDQSIMTLNMSLHNKIIHHTQN